MNTFDKFTNIDDLLVTLIERIGGVTEEDTHFFSYPNDGTRATIAKGTTALDFMGGTVMDTDGTVTSLGNSLRARGREYCRSLSLQADRNIIIQIGTKSKIPIFAGTWFKVSHLRFTDLKIIAAETTRVFAVACTNPDSVDMAGETYVKDPVDTWGKVTTIGNAELAVRTHAPPIVFDRRGDVIRWADFESSTEKCTTTTYNSTVARSNDCSNTGDFSEKICATSHPAVSTLTMKTQDYHVGNIGLQAQFSVTDLYGWMLLRIGQFTGTHVARYDLRLDFDNKTIGYVGGAGLTTIDTFDLNPTLTSFSTAKLVVDLTSQHAIRAIVFGKEYDLAVLNCTADVTGHPDKAHLDTGIMAASTGTGNNTIYIDNLIITENEPI